MSKISLVGFEKALKNYLMTLEPMAKNVPTKSQASSSADGTMSVKQEKGDIFLDKQQASAFAKAISKAADEHFSSYIHDIVVQKINELIDQYNQLRLDVIAGAIPTTATEVDKISTT